MCLFLSSKNITCTNITRGVFDYLAPGILCPVGKESTVDQVQNMELISKYILSVFNVNLCKNMSFSAHCLGDNNIIAIFILLSALIRSRR